MFENDIKDNDSYNVAVLSYLITGREYNDPEYDPYAEGISIHDNTFVGRRPDIRPDARPSAPP